MDKPEGMPSIPTIDPGSTVAYELTREERRAGSAFPLLIFGASGRTGRYLVERSLSEGYLVTAFVRERGSLSVQHARLHVVEGDVLNPEAVDSAMLGQRAVLSALGFSGPRQGEALVRATQNIVLAMRKYRVHRLVCLAPPPAREGWARRGLLGRLLTPFRSKRPYPWERQLDSVRGSPLEWVLVRPTRLTDDPARGTYQVSVGWAPVSAGISRADVAAFMLDQVQSRRYIRLAPVLGG